MASLLYGVSPYDPVALAGGSVVFLLAVALASSIPSMGAAGIPPALALRGD